MYTTTHYPSFPYPSSSLTPPHLLSILQYFFSHPHTITTTLQALCYLVFNYIPYSHPYHRLILILTLHPYSTPGSLLSGVQLAISMSNTGGAWDNAKKYIEGGKDPTLGGKGSDIHKAAVVGDTVGDPLKVCYPTSNYLLP